MSKKTSVMTPDRPLVTIAQACALVQANRRTLYNWMQTGKVEYIRTAGGMRRIYVDTLFRAETPKEPAA